MNFHWLQALRALILLSFSAYIFKLHHTGEIGRFINPEYVLFSQIASVIFLFLFFIQVPRIWRDRSDVDEDHSNCGPWGCNHEDGYMQRFSIKTVLSYGIILIPLATGFLLPGKDLDASIASKRGVFITSSNHADHEELNCSDEDLLITDTVLQQSNLLNEPFLILDSNNFASHVNIISQNAELFKGKPIQLEGFVLKDEAVENQWVIARFQVTHCVADASVIGVLVKLEENIEIIENSWIKVQGILEVSTHNQRTIPLIEVKKWELMKQPKEPYVYPSKNQS
jgi:putative membrane protein